jgi:transposase
MGRTIKIELNQEQRAELEQGFRSSDNHAFRVRCQMLLLKAEKRKSSEIGEILGFCEQAVNGWLWRYKEEGIEGLKNKPGQGRIPILKLEKDAQPVRLSVCEHRQRISQARAELEDKLGKQFSEKTLRRFLKNLTADIAESESVPEKRKAKKSISISEEF